MITLAIDASTYLGDVALINDGRVLAERSVEMKDAYVERLMPAVASVLGENGVAVRDLERIVCGGGPGSFTSLRIAGGIAKGLAAGADVPLYSVPSLALMVAGASLPVGRYLATLDALRGEFYVGLYHVSATGDVIELEKVVVVPADQVAERAARAEARIVSPSGMGDVIRAQPKAAGVVRLEQLLFSSGPVDLASWEPTYGRLAEAQVKWESLHGRPLPV
ncbi:MAG TPA: tRNA (adenosine(37)-N6)-threonylcarbamoyltransferase complex dimerization subunit type 1 TsaB [Gemmatimonadaceae bacterium]